MPKNPNSISIITDGSHRAVQANELAKVLENYELKHVVQISCGLDVVEKAAASSAEFKVHISDPGKLYDAFDLIFMPSHDPHPVYDNIYETTGIINHISPEYLKGKERDFGLKPPYLAVLVGGRHVGGNFSEHDALRLAAQINGQEHAALITTSKRTEAPAIKILRENIKVLHYFYDIAKEGMAENPYEAMLAVAQTIIVTADSVRMVSEAASSGKEIEIFVPEQVHFSYLALKDAVLKAKLPLNEAKRCAEIILAKINL